MRRALWALPGRRRMSDKIGLERELARHARHQELLARATTALHRSLDPDTELQALGWAAVPELADLASVHRLARPVSPDEPPPLPVVTDRVVVAAAAQYAHLPNPDPDLSWDAGSPVVQAIQAGESVLLSLDVHHPPAWAHDAGLTEIIRGGVQHAVAASVIVENLVVAVVLFWRRADRPVWTEEEFALLGQLTESAGHALAQGLSYQHTRDTALTLQRSLLTEPPAVAGLEICVRYRPAGADEVGGDWYDALLLGDTLAVTVGDVVGHDITAAAAMGQLRATLRSILALDLASDPGVVLDCLDTATTRLGITSFVTLVHGHLRRVGENWSFRWASAGHPPPLLLTAAGRPRWLDEAGGLVIGTGLRHGERSSAAATLRCGDTLLLYTDGLIERRGQPLDDGLQELATTVVPAGRPLNEVCDALVHRAPADDDVAILALRAR
jgi:hypothetical protein